MANVAKLAADALTANDGLFRLAPTWVPRSFLQPGQAAQAASGTTTTPSGTHRGGIDERWFASTTAAAERQPRRRTKASATVVVGKRKVHAARRGRQNWGRTSSARRSGRSTSAGRSTPSSSTTWGRSRITCTRTTSRPKLVGQEGKPESYYFPPQLNAIGNNFPYTFMGLEPGTTKQDVVDCLERWNEGDNGILDLSKAYRLQARHRLAHPAVRPARAGLAGDLRAAVGQRRLRHVPVDGRRPGRAVGAAGEGRPEGQARRPRLPGRRSSTGRRTSIRISRTTTTSNRSPSADTAKEGYVDRWIVYGKVDGEQLFTAKELTVEPGAKCTIKDGGAYGWITVQGEGRIGKLRLQTPAMIRFGELTEDEVFVTAKRPREGVDVREHRHRTAGRPALLRPGCLSRTAPNVGRSQEEEISSE